MIRVEKPDLTDTEWTQARMRAAVARQQLVAEFDASGDASVDDALYKQFKAFLLHLFNDKCAYCESLISNAQPGDVEHFRPKGRVVDEDFKPVRIHHPRWGDMAHPGYFWLAYEWKNLFPACIDCNRYRKHGSGTDDGAGKADRFPVLAFRAFLPDDEINEAALLIDPSQTDPSEHLDFLETGEVVPKTEVGRITLHVLGLNRREKLIAARRSAYANARRLLQSYCVAVVTENTLELEELRKEVNEVWSGRQPYTAMQRAALEHVKAKASRRGIPIVLPLPGS